MCAVCYSPQYISVVSVVMCTVDVCSVLQSTVHVCCVCSDVYGRCVLCVTVHSTCLMCFLPGALPWNVSQTLSILPLKGNIYVADERSCEAGGRQVSLNAVSWNKLMAIHNCCQYITAQYRVTSWCAGIDILYRLITLLKSIIICSWNNEPQ